MKFTYKIGFVTISYLYNINFHFLIAEQRHAVKEYRRVPKQPLGLQQFLP